MSKNIFFKSLLGLIFIMISAWSISFAQTNRIEIMETSFWSWVDGMRNSNFLNTNTKEDYRGVKIDTKCINGICKTSKEYLNKADVEYSNQKIKKRIDELNLRIESFKTKMQLQLPV